MVAKSVARLDTWRMSRAGDDPHRAADHEHASELSETQLRVRALESLLVDKGYVDPAALDVLIETYETRVGPHNGARVVARAWVDPGFRRWLLTDSGAAIASLGYGGRQGEHLVALGVRQGPHLYLLAEARRRLSVHPADLRLALPSLPQLRAAVLQPRPAVSGAGHRAVGGGAGPAVAGQGGDEGPPGPRRSG